jgi:hydroxylaminobenzene mutase
MEPEATKRRFIRHGVLVFLFGLLAGVFVPWVANPRMGLSAHLGGVLSGAFLMVMGLAWSEVKLQPRAERIAVVLFLYATHTGWLAQFLAAIFGTGRSMPVVGAGYRGALWQENLVDFVAISFSLAIAAAGLLALWGLRKGAGRQGV